MYDVLFIDDKFDEIKDTYFRLKKEHIRCYYSAGYEEELPDEEKFAFTKVRYVCLDFYLENRGINTSTPPKMLLQHLLISLMDS